MNKKNRVWRNQKGVTIVIVAGLTVMFVAFTALSVDIAHLMVVRNELQNAADSGALAGARRLYFPDGTAVNTDANQVAYEMAIVNNSERIAVEVNDWASNTGDVQRGHWSFATQAFTASNNTIPPDLWNITSAELDADTTYVNAVMVRTRRQSTQATSFFARILGFTGFNASAEAVAYIGFAGSIAPGEVDLPIAMCEEALTINDEYTCSVGRMINSGSSATTNNSGGWTDYNQDDPCSGGTDANTLGNLLSSCPPDGNPEMFMFGEDMALTNGMVSSVFKQDFYDCWVAQTNKQQFWEVTLPVISCPGNIVGPTCSELRGVVEVSIIWINDQWDPHYDNAPTQMMSNDDPPVWNWSNNDPDGQIRWNDFVSTFGLVNLDGSPASYLDKSIYFLPHCGPHETAGVTGGQNFGIIASRPVLVN